MASPFPSEECCLMAYFVKVFAVSQDLTQKISFPMHIPDRADHDPYLLDDLYL